MIKKLIIGTLVLGLTTSCVSKKVYSDLEKKYNNLAASKRKMSKEKKDLEAEKARLNKELNDLKGKHGDLASAKDNLQSEYDALKSQFDKLQEDYDLLEAKSSSTIKKNLARNKDLLAQLEAKENALAEENARLSKLQEELAQRSARVDELEKLMAANEAKMLALKSAVSNALKAFEGKGLTVEHKNGKVYVSMENKLLFNSGSWAVGSEGKKAIKTLASVLSENTDINVLIEGHTDNVPFAKRGAILDNWDLSTKRATAIVRVLQGNGVGPEQISAAGRSEYVPIETNKTKIGKAKNRRIEIILEPNLDEISKLLNE
ncbi:flagellar motor protein MotB [Aureivirga sp. CE67]|uniref:OmpA/MotB family protein n=1 Tax=Aureivirga sp. CE67 TaxID=1788983 RepID=UPI0018C9291F|nr:OmpA family protein [Aureivirga sp. CE67]